MKRFLLRMQTLPIDSYLPAIVSSLSARGQLILKAEPGAGKTTRVPAAFLSAMGSLQVIVLEPRRLATKLAAARVAEELGTILGKQVGYRVRQEGACSAETKLLFVTEGLFFRMLLDDPQLKSIGVVVLDEFHERQVHCDLALAAAKMLQETVRPDLKLCVMSATLDSTSLQAYLPNAEVFDVAGKTFPVEIEYLAPNAGEDLLSTVKRAALKMLEDPRCPGDILVFLTGIAEIFRAEGILKAALPTCNILPLTAELSHVDQARVFRPSEKRKIVLATNVAETSVTIPGITGVIDTGLAKQAGHAAWNGLSTLDIKKVSQASCIQRAGRAGRTVPGVAYRLFAEQDFFARPAFTTPEVRRLDMTQTLLEAIALATKLKPEKHTAAQLLPWFEQPDPSITASAEQALTRLGAITTNASKDGVAKELVLTELGKKMSAWPLHPRLAAMIIAGEKLNIKLLASLAACVISERFLFSRGFQATEVSDCDLRYQLELFFKFLQNKLITPRLVADALDKNKIHRITRLYESLTHNTLKNAFAEWGKVDDRFAEVILAGFPDRLAKRRTLKKEHEGHRTKILFNFCLGRGGQLASSSVCRDEDLIVTLDASEAVTSQDAAQGITIWSAAGVKMATVLKLDNDLNTTDDVCVWNADAQRVDAVNRTLYGQLVLKEERGSASNEAIEVVLRQALLDHWPKPFSDATDLESYHARVQIIAKTNPECNLPLFTGEMLELLVASICEGKRSFKEIIQRTLYDYIGEQLSYEQQQQLNHLTPQRLKLNNGRELKVTYEAALPPWVSGFIQDFYGVSASPKIMNGQMPLSIHLQGPNRRPLQVTSDLEGFWRSTYPAIKNELSRNYPRHHWPEEPLTAPPVLHKSRL
jgi:ATP-dependent helicase HrpB